VRAINPGFTYTGNDLTISFTDQSNGAVQWFWDFGDGTISTSQNPTHTYAMSGTVEVCMIAYNLCTSDTICQSVIVQCPTFIADFTFEASNYTVSFSDESDNTAMHWSWDFGDGQTSALQSPIHVYAQEGEYNVCLISSDDCSSDTMCQIVTVIISSAGVVNGSGDSFTVFPNPLSGNGIVSFTIAEASRIQVRPF
jgi:PKD repeat protein